METTFKQALLMFVLVSYDTQGEGGRCNKVNKENVEIVFTRIKVDKNLPDK